MFYEIQLRNDSYGPIMPQVHYILTKYINIQSCSGSFSPIPCHFPPLEHFFVHHQNMEL